MKGLWPSPPQSRGSKRGTIGLVDKMGEKGSLGDEEFGGYCSRMHVVGCRGGSGRNED